MKILIDARFLGTSTGIGRYVEGLVGGLEKIFSEVEPLSFIGPEAPEALRARSRFDLNDVEFVVLVSKDGWEKWQAGSLEKITEVGPRPQAQYEIRPRRFRKKLVDVRWYTVREQLALWRALREEKPDLVHFPHWNICYFWRGPFVVTIHDLILLEYPTRRASQFGAISYFIKYRILFPLVLRQAIYGSRKIIAPSNYTKQSILKHFPRVAAEKIEVIYEDAPKINIEVEPPSFAPCSASGLQSASRFDLNPRNYLLYVGNALPHKNLEFLVRVFKKIKEQLAIESEALSTGPEAPRALRAQHVLRAQDRLKLILVGEASYFYMRLEKYVRELGLQNDVVFTGRVSDEDLAALYKNARAYVFPSLLEGFGLPPLEAMAYGLPVVAADSSCLPEILGEAALYFDPRDESDALSKIIRILSDESLRAGLVNKGYEQIQKYDWGKMAGYTFEVFTSIIRS